MPPLPMEQLLPKPVRDVLAPYKRWIISPGGPLWNIPFETLTDGDSLVLDHRIVRYVHSWTMFTMLTEVAKTRSRTGTTPFLAIGGATYKDYRVPAGASDQYEHWRDLSFSAKEINLVVDHFGLKDGKTVFRGKAALRSTLLELNASKALSHVGTLLVSGHGYLNRDNPALSALVLGRPEEGYERDRYLTARELAAFDIPADLVVVSSCSSGSGRVAAGEGILGLPYALFAAGTSTAVVTRWDVFDNSATAGLVSDLLIGVDSGKSPDETLTLLKREIRRTKPEAYWASFVLLGH